ncbi:MAG: AMP-binding protein [Proteobacteria bacterium]|nr:AMP-binding protein [Pseudomonadota bacterium]
MSNPASTLHDAIRGGLLAPGAPFELARASGAEGAPLVYRQAPRTLTEFLAGATTLIERPFLLYEGRRLSYAETLAAAASLATVLQSRYAVRPGTHVGIALRNGPECVIALLAAAALGAVLVVANSRGTADELAAALIGSRCGLVLADPRCGAALEGALAAARIALLVAAAECREGELSGWAQACAGASAGATWEAVLARDLDPESAALILFTSGTTGRPKGAVLTHRGVMTSIWANQFAAAQVGLEMAARYGIDPAVLAARAGQPCLLLVYPLFHTSGLHSGLFASIARGGRMVLLRRWDVATALRLIQEERVTMMPGVPTMYWDLLQYPGRSDFDLSSLTSVSTGGQAMPLNLLAGIREAFPNCVIGNGYGLTEANGAVALVVGQDFLARRSTSGRVLPSCELRIVREDGCDADVGEPGEIRVRGAHVMAGYWDDAEATAAAVQDGWLLTGDVGERDAEGFLYIVDRKKDMVICGGENIYCAEVERVIQTHPDVHEVATFGLPDDRLGERLVAVVVPHAGRQLTQSGVSEWVAVKLAAYKVPAQVWFQEDALRRNDLGKIDKVVLRRRYAAAAPDAEG